MLTHCVLTRVDKPRYVAASIDDPWRVPYRLSVLAASTLIALVLAASPAAAQQVIIIDDVQTTTNGGATIDGNDQITVTENGSITVTNEDGILANGANNIIQVDGIIRTQGTDSGIDSRGEGARITVNGSIIVNAYEAIRVSGDNTTIINNGTIESQNSQAFEASITSFGSTLINTGTIRTTGNGDQAVVFRRTGTVINSGLIATSASGIEAVQLSSGGIVVNTGIIWTTGLDAEAIFIADGAVVTNSGRIISERGPAIFIHNSTEADDTINLLAPGFIGGNIDFSNRDDVLSLGTETIISIVTGPSHSTFWTLEGRSDSWAGGAPNISGTVPWFYNAATQSVATFDPTLLSSETAALGDLTSLLSRVGLGAVQGFGSGLGSGLGSGFSSGDHSALGYLPVNDDGDAVSQRLGRAWVTALGGQMHHEGSGTTLESTIGHFGFAGGYTWQHAPNMILNAMAGYVAGNTAADARWSPSFDHDTHTFFAGLHGERSLGWGQFGEAAVQFGLTAGYSHIDHNRFVNDNLAPLGESWVSADYGGFFVSPELGLATDIELADGMTLTPNAGLRYAAQWLDGYSETGAVSAAANATVEDRFVGTLEAQIGLDATRSFDIGDRTGTLTGRIGYLGRWSGGDDGASIALNGVTQSVASGPQDLNALYLGATLRSDIGETAFLELDANYLVGDTAHGFDGRLTAGFSF